ncbi:hypothetical protein B0A49_07372 [Cryomyces minteri]|uniref:Uncharacterized protein n=1 Tax=Cryomyces minteri TaxID=331657 RepID=A0A4U0X9D6_9PEZI|nr:hypothetical protein B0A49_07372 [Cryomyces minteri]
MSNFQYGASHYPSAMNVHSNHASSTHHHGRSRRGPRISSSQNSNKQFRATRSPKETPEVPISNACRRDFEAAKSFDLEDDELFCPFDLLTEDDVNHEGRAEEAEHHKQDQLKKQKEGKRHWKDELASDSESIIKAERGEIDASQDTIKKLQDETAKMMQQKK